MEREPSMTEAMLTSSVHANQAIGPRDRDHLRWLERGVTRDVAGKACLDLGCGGGYVCAELLRAGARFVAGVDIEPPDARNASGAWSFRQVDLDRPGWDDEVPRAADGGAFDLITGFDIIEHLASPVRFLEGCRR